MRKFLFVAVTMLLVGYRGESMADEVKVNPVISVRQEYNDNIFFDTNNEKSSFITRVRPGLEVSERTERMDLQLAGYVTPFFYWDESDLNSIDQEYNGRFSYQLTPLLNLGADAGVIVDHQPDRDVLTTGLTYGDFRRIQQHYNGNANWMFTELWSASASYGYTREDWRNVSRTSDIEDWQSHSVILGLARELGSAPGTTLGLLNAGYAYYDYQTSSTNYYFTSVGAQHRLTEVYNIKADIGVRYVETDFKVQQPRVVPPGVVALVTQNESTSGWGGMGHLEGEYVGERLRASLGASHDIYPASGGGGVVQRSGITGKGQFLLLENLRIGLFASAFRNKSETQQFTGSEINQYAYNVNPSLRWEFHRDFTLEAGHTFTYVDNRTEDGNAVRNLVYIQLAYGLPLLD